MKRKLVSAVDTGYLGVSFANDVPNTSGLMQFFAKLGSKVKLDRFWGFVPPTHFLRASGLGKLTRMDGLQMVCHVTGEPSNNFF